MSAWAKPGVKVVCIDASPTAIWGLPPLVVGAIYTIAKVVPPTPEDERWGCILVEQDSNSAMGFVLDRFRPLITKTIEDDMELFAPLLKVDLVGAPV